VWYRWNKPQSVAPKTSLKWITQYRCRKISRAGFTRTPTEK
jgi:hypothetical protein